MVKVEGSARPDQKLIWMLIKALDEKARLEKENARLRVRLSEYEREVEDEFFENVQSLGWALECLVRQDAARPTRRNIADQKD
ncbi:hypothetical protein ACLOJK_001701 [Asimina triloba]